MFLPRKNTQKCAKKVENVNFDTLRQPFWIPPFFGGGTLVFKLFSTFSSKMGSRGIKSPIYPEFMMIWNYALKITPYSPPLVQVSIFVTCLNFAGTGLRLYVAFVMTWYLAFTTSGRTAKAMRSVISGNYLGTESSVYFDCRIRKPHFSGMSGTFINLRKSTNSIIKIFRILTKRIFFCFSGILLPFFFIWNLKIQRFRVIS